MRKGTLYASAKNISSQATLDASSEPVRQGTPIASAEMIPSGRASAGELNENAVMESTKLNAQGSMFLQNFVHEWFEFVGRRTRQHLHLIKTIQGCRSLPDLQQAHSEFWQNAFTQYAEEPRRMLLVTQGAVADASHSADGNGATEATLH
jgi:hypothetical protein